MMTRFIETENHKMNFIMYAYFAHFCFNFHFFFVFIVFLFSFSISISSSMQLFPHSPGELGSYRLVWPGVKEGWRIRYSCDTDGRPDGNNLWMDKCVPTYSFALVWNKCKKSVEEKEGTLSST